jgi:hypothetical protein
MRGFGANCEGNLTCFGFFAVQLFKACASAVGHRRRLNDGFRLVTDVQRGQPDDGSRPTAAIRPVIASRAAIRMK